MSLRTAAQQALEALEERYVGALRDKAMDALRTALADPEQEPVAWRYKFARGVRWDFAESDPAEWRDLDVTAEPLYTHPPQRRWVGLTAPEQLECYDLNPARFANNVELKLKEKNT
jgi:hypothetical protein